MTCICPNWSKSRCYVGPNWAARQSACRKCAQGKYARSPTRHSYGQKLMEQERIMQRIQKDVRALLIASKNGLSIHELEQDYRMMIGSHIPIRSLGYKSTMELLLDMPSVVKIHTQLDGTVKLSAVVDETTRRIADLVSCQKDRCTARTRNRRRNIRPRCPVDLVRRGRVSPVLPATVKSDLRDLLSVSPLLLSELEKAFSSRFGRSFQYTRYGFYSMLEVLRSITDIVEVKQTRAGSLLVLRNSETGRISASLCVKQSQLAIDPKKTSCVLEQCLKEPRTPEKKTSETVTYLKVSPPEPQKLSSKESPSVTRSTSPLINSSNKEQRLKLNVLLDESLKSNENKAPPVTNFTSAVPSHNSVLSNSLVGNSVSSETLFTKMSRPTSHVEADHSAASEPDASVLEWLEKKLEKELKLCLARKGAGGSVSDALRMDIQHVVNQHSDGLKISQLPTVFKSFTGKDLPFKELGFISVMELVGSLGDILCVESTVDGKDWKLFDAKKKDLVDEFSAGLPSTSSILSSWNSSQQTTTPVKPVGTIFSKVDEKLWIDIPPDAVRNQKLHCLPSMKRGFMIGVYVENIESPSQFYVRCCGKDTSEKLEDMMIEMRHCYSNECVSERYIVTDNCISVGQIYALRVPGDVWWYRVIVHDIKNSELLDVFYPDFGNVATVKKSWLRFLKNCYMKIPAQAVPSSLPYVTSTEDQWSAQAIKKFQQLCSCIPLVGMVLQYVQDILHIFLCDTSSEEDLYLHQLLISQGLAKMEPEHACKKISKKRNPFMQYLTPSQEQPQEESSQLSVPSESSQSEIPCAKEVKDEDDLGMPYLEAFPSGSDVWDENWAFSDGACDYDTAPTIPKVDTQKQQENKVSQETQPFKFCIDSADASVVHHPLEEFYISLIKSRKSQESTDIQQSPPTEEQHVAEISHRSATEQLQGGSSSSMLCEKKLYYEKEDLPYCQQSKCSFSPLLGFQRLQIPRSATPVALGPAARLATAGRLLYWASEPR
ncbi:tudor domain-containing protein 5 isoform X2 [Xenopus tropicalis]|uniref:Tudor domain-containing protein 5 n=1 Tax=Xenopus tropicalis TaxID=8364 RepID=A0A8J1JGJ2_XENTR|nr:tudor domain-containing protein 5 isoform X2 [Xenopus tropicalis]